MWSRPRKPSAIADVSDRDLVRLHWPSELRPAFDALFAIDDALADVVFKASQPALGAIKLAWWRDRLIALDAGAVPAEPRLASAAADLLPRGVAGADLAELVTGWATLLDEQPQPDLVAERGARLFGLAARLLGASGDPVAEAGRFWAPVALARA